MDEAGIAVVVELEVPQVGRDHLVEDALVAAHDDELTERTAAVAVRLLFGEVVQDLGAVGVEPSGGQRVHQPELLVKSRERWTDAL